MKKTLRVKDIQTILGIGQNKAYDLVKEAFKTKMFPVKKIGSIYLIPQEPFLNWMDNL